MAGVVLLTSAAALAIPAVALLPVRSGPVAGGTYRFSLTSAPRRVLHWPAGSAIRVFVNGRDGGAAIRLERAFRAAAADWEAALDGIRLQATPRVAETDGPAAGRRLRFRTTSRVTDADVVVAWAGSRLPVETAGCEPIDARSAVTTFCADTEWSGLRPFPLLPPYTHEPSQVRMLVLIRPAAAPTLTRARQLLAHELGHVLGIGQHSPEPDHVMWGGPLQALAPTAADRATARALYRTRADFSP